jgi:hypothetical protein
MLGRVALRISLKRRATEEPSTASSSRVGMAMGKDAAQRR